MLSREVNEYLTHTDPGTPMGALLRRFWFPALLSEELPEPDSAPVRLRIMGEDLVAYRATDGSVGILGDHCPHRGASLFFGRNEEGGLRCVYHGWKFDTSGACVDMPNEPPESNFKEKIHHIAYPTVERSGVIWAYMGPADKQPQLPELEWSRVPENHLHVTKRFQENNFLQAIEGGIDSSHASFLHSWVDDEARPKVATVGKLGDLLFADKHPRFEVLETDYGLVVGARRDVPGQHYWRISQFLSPWFQMIPSEPGGVISGHAWIPIDDHHCWAWSITWHPDRPMSEAELARSSSGYGIHATLGEKYIPVANKSNDYLIDREDQRTRSFTGIKGIGEQDMACQESMGYIYDRTQEHLGSSDTAIIQMRRLLQKLAQDLEEGREPLAAQRPDAYRVRSTSFLLDRDQDWTAVARSTSVAESPYYAR